MSIIVIIIKYQIKVVKLNFIFILLLIAQGISKITKIFKNTMNSNSTNFEKQHGRIDEIRYLGIHFVNFTLYLKLSHSAANFAYFYVASFFCFHIQSLDTNLIYLLLPVIAGAP